MTFCRKLLICMLCITQTVLCRCQVTCLDVFEALSASEFVARLSPGWNLGNTLDSIPDEGSWNNPVVLEQTFDDVKAAGFKSVRVPVTWINHFVGTSDQGDSPEWKVNPEWLQRVADVADMVTSRGLYAIINVHHDSHFWADLTVPNANYTMIEEKFYRLWYQIGTKLACAPSLLAFEPINEAPGDTAEIASQQHKLNNVFLQAINDAGGFNPQRVVTLSGPGQDIIRTSLWFEAPDPAFLNPYAIQVHYYGPYDFTSAAWGQTIWGTDEDLTEFEYDFSQLRGNFTDVPIVVGEWLVSPVLSEPAARWRYYDFLARISRKYDFSPIIWDSGNDHLDRISRTWHDSTGLSVHFNALAGNSNSLPEATRDPSVTSQFTSAFAFHKAGEPIANIHLPFAFNGNTIQSIYDGSSILSEGVDYSVEEDQIILHDSLLAQYFNLTASPGIKATLTASFSDAPSIPIQVVLWDTPTLSASSVNATSIADIEVPVDWNSIGKPATMAAFKADGTPLVDEWTTQLPYLQRGRTTFGGSWNWNWGQRGVTILSSAIAAAAQSGGATTFVLESYPRVPDNNATFTVFV